MFCTYGKKSRETQRLQVQEMEDIVMERWQDSPTEVVKGVALPLKNLEFLIDQYLLANGTRLDVETRHLLAGVRDCLGQVACSTTRLGQYGN